MNLDGITITWEKSTTIFDRFGKEYESCENDPEKQHLSLVLVKKKATLSEIVTGLIGIMGLHLAIKTGGWERLVMAVFIIAIISPFDLKHFKKAETKEIFDLVESEYGDQYLSVAKLDSLYNKKPQMKAIIDSFVRNDLLEKEENGKMFFVGTVLKNVDVKLFNKD